MSVAVKVNNLSKVYKIYDKRLDRLKETFLPGRKQYHRPFNALHDVNLEIQRGETVGIVGRNGSGKSTLLQIICGILQPTTGSLEVNGRISALLELGAGFNPEFTGLENIFLNASILGMEKKETEACLDDILDFAEIGRFIDQPVKTYSSGMFVRLAFAVAINVKPDILIVDEALSVGDTLFQAKCFAKFREFQEKNVTILFVTHSDELITRYCDSAILLNNGEQVMCGTAKKVIDRYRRLLAGVEEEERAKREAAGESPGEQLITQSAADENNALILSINPNEDRYGSGEAEIIDFGINALDPATGQLFITGARYQFWVRVKFHASKMNPVVAYTIRDVKGLEVTGTNTLHQEIDTGSLQNGDEIIVTFDQKLTLNPGDYLLSFGCSGFEEGNYVVYDRRFDVVPFQVISKRLTVGLVDLDSKIRVSKVEK